MAWNSLYKEFCPKLQSRYVSILTQILAFDFGDNASNIASGVAAFEKFLRQYETQTGKVVEGDLKLGVITKNMKNNSLKEHLVRHAAHLSTWSCARGGDRLLVLGAGRRCCELAVHDRLLAPGPGAGPGFIDGRAFGHCLHSNFFQDNSQPMEIGGLPKG